MDIDGTQPQQAGTTLLQSKPEVSASAPYPMENTGAKQQSEGLKVKHERREHEEETSHKGISQDGVQHTLQSAPSRQKQEQLKMVGWVKTPDDQDAEEG